MILRLLPSQVPKWWELIKFGTLSVNGLVSEPRVMEYCNNLLASLMSEKYQAWVGVDDTTKEIKGVAITAIRKDIGGIPYLLIEAVYGFVASPLNDHDDFASQMVAFARNAGCDSVYADITIPRIKMAAERLGMIKVSERYRIIIGKGG